MLGAATAHAAEIDVVRAESQQASVLRGAIIEGVSERFAALGQIAHPVIVLASPGGWVTPALAIGRQISMHGLTTVVRRARTACWRARWSGSPALPASSPTPAASDCTPCLQVGEGRLETHAFDGVLRRYLEALGDSLDTTATIVNTPAAAVRWMDSTELNAAGIATVGDR